MTVGGAQFSEIGRLVGGQIFEPVSGFARSAGADVDREKRIGADLVQKIHVFMGPEGVRLDHAAPVWIEGLSPLSSDAVAPVVFVGKASARIADVRDLDRSEGVDDIAADASR